MSHEGQRLVRDVTLPTRVGQRLVERRRGSFAEPPIGSAGLIALNAIERALVQTAFWPPHSCQLLNSCASSTFMATSSARR